MQPRRIVNGVAIAMFALGTLYAVGLQQAFRHMALQGAYFHPWSSEDMMQTVSIRELRQAPLETLLNIHIQPPAFDALRAGLAQFWPSLSDRAALVQVDRSLYFVDALLLGLLVAVAFHWLAAQTGVAIATVGALLLMLHPATIFFATYLDSTFLSAVLLLCTCYLLWQVKNGAEASIFLLSGATVALFFTRSVFQWPAILVFAASLALMKVPRRRLIGYLVLAGLFTGPYLAKQELFFGSPSSSSFTGLNLSNSIGKGMGSAKYGAYLNDPGHATHATASMPSVLRTTTKLEGQPNFNHIDYLFLNEQLLNRYRKDLLRLSIADLLRNYIENAGIYLRPSSTYSSHHVIVDNLPWRMPYEYVFSAPVLPILLLVAVAVWVARLRRSQALLKGLGLLLPGLFVMAVSIVSDKGENMRFKFFLEPVMLIFLVSQFHALARIGLRRLVSTLSAG